METKFFFAAFFWNGEQGVTEVLPIECEQDCAGKYVSNPIAHIGDADGMTCSEYDKLDELGDSGGYEAGVFFYSDGEIVPITTETDWRSAVEMASGFNLGYGGRFEFAKKLPEGIL